MFWMTDTTTESSAARLEAMHRHVRCSTRCMAFIAAGAATMQMLLDVTYMFCL